MSPADSDKPWLAGYPEGIPATIDFDRYDSLVDLLAAGFATYRDRPAYSNRGTTLTFAQVDRLSAAFSTYLLSSTNLAPGDRVAVMMPNLLQSPIVLFGILRAGLVVVNVNPMYTSRELAHQLSDSGARAIVVLDNFTAPLAEIIDETEIELVVLTSVGDQHATAKRWLIDFVVRYWKRLVPRTSFTNSVRYRAAIAKGASLPPSDRAPEAGDTAFLQYTGGTTGVAKGAQLSHRNVLSNVQQMSAWARPYFDPDSGVVVTPLPVYHIFALTVGILGFFDLGGHNLLITDPRDTRSLIRELARHRFTCILGVNTLFNALVHTEGFTALNFDWLKISLAGGMAVQRDVADRWRELTGNIIAQGYGLTEASPVVTANPLTPETFDGSIGMPLPSTDVAIFGDDNQRLGVGEVGEICVKGPQVMVGYWNRPAETREVMFADGWLRTGDVGRMDERGHFFVEDRIKDMIVVSGFKVFPNEVEDVIMQHPGVLEAAAVGVPNAESEQAVKVYAVKKAPQLTAAELIEYSRKYLTAYKVPREIEFVDALPKTNIGKVLRRALTDAGKTK